MQFCLLNANFASNTSQHPRIHTHSRVFWQQLSETLLIPRGAWERESKALQGHRAKALSRTLINSSCVKRNGSL